jgi:nucleoside-diphosphate-sugar epimerase
VGVEGLGRVIVTGASGFLGSHLMRRLSSMGFETVGLSSQSLRRHGGEVEPAPWLSDPSAVAEYVGATKPVVIFHLATSYVATPTSSDISRLVRANVEFGVGIAEGASRAGSLIVYAASSFQRYQGTRQPTTLYAATKQAYSEILNFYASTRDVPVQQAYLFDTYGPNDRRDKLVNVLMAACDVGTPVVLGSPEKLINLTYVDDVCRSLVALMTELPKRQDWVIRSPTSISLSDLVSTLSGISGRDLDITWDPRRDRRHEMREDWAFGQPIELDCRIALDDGLKLTWYSWLRRGSSLATIWLDQRSTSGGELGT